MARKSVLKDGTFGEKFAYFDKLLSKLYPDINDRLEALKSAQAVLANPGDENLPKVISAFKRVDGDVPRLINQLADNMMVDIESQQTPDPDDSRLENELVELNSSLADPTNY
jgi:hypothetical protein